MGQQKIKKYNDRILTDIFEANIPKKGDRQG